MTNVVPFPGGKKTVADVIEEIADGGVSELVVLGYDREGKEFFSATIKEGPEVNWLLDRLKFKLQTGL